MPLLTPDERPGYVSRLFTVPAQYEAFLDGMIQYLTDPTAWKEFGECTIEDSVAVFERCIQTAIDLGPGDIVPLDIWG